MKVSTKARTPALVILQHKHENQSVKTIAARMRTTVLILRKNRTKSVIIMRSVK